MTGEEFTTRFNSLVSSENGINLADATALRDEVLADYNSANTNLTLLNTTKDRITQLENTNKELQETNLKLFMMLPSETKKDDGKEDDNPPSPPGNTDTSPSVDDVVSAMLGKASNK